MIFFKLFSSCSFSSAYRDSLFPAFHFKCLHGLPMFTNLYLPVGAFCSDIMLAEMILPFFPREWKFIAFTPGSSLSLYCLHLWSTEVIWWAILRKTNWACSDQPPFPLVQLSHPRRTDVLHSNGAMFQPPPSFQFLQNMAGEVRSYLLGPLENTIHHVLSHLEDSRMPQMTETKRNLRENLFQYHHVLGW